jgi:hypothetical protein
MTGMRYAFRILLGNAEGERQLGKVKKLGLKVFAIFGFCERGI